jgi:hypothetical protein
MTPQPPERSPEQRDEALKLAEEARTERAAVKAKVHRSELSIVDVLERGTRGRTDELGSHARVYGGIEIGQLLDSVPHVGPVKRDKALEAAGGVDPDTHLDELTGEQRDQIQGWLAENVG